MRISDAMMSANYLNDLDNTRTKLDKLQRQMSSQKKIQSPSDDPAGTSRVMGYQVKSAQTDIYQKNIDSGLSFIKETLSTMSDMDTSVADVLQTITASRNANLNSSDMQNIATKIDSAINGLLDLANSQYDGRYLYSGTDQSTAPVGYTADKKSIEIKPADITGSQNIRISENKIQGINLPGSELFSTIVTQSGNLDSSSAVNSTATSSTQVYDDLGNPYTLNLTYKKTAANTYDMTYDIVDGTNTSVFATPPAAKQLVFDSSTGMLQSIDGKAPAMTNITVPGNKIEFLLDSSQILEKNQAASVTNTANQKTSIFNTLIAIRDNLKNGIAPTADQEAAVQSFYNNLLNKESKMGNVQNQMESVQTLLQGKSSNYKDLISSDMDVDVAKLLIDLQNQQYVLETSYKMASMILPKSLMDYL